ncbi:LysR substrate-binding domain-containing protein [Paracoccus methylarcula]|uniref:HTH lysR-type domain-containing protein n=1 Tax=Paracoccus methylarcula TaxID=72022 RepID=A0A422QWL7_9RHOB|nr:LysR substrate-binding domain-containing protein [Paracoccus methylarcula]RNF34321.1 hypothetical protein A7A09_010425 [Paracoccus methylarcula]
MPNSPEHPTRWHCEFLCSLPHVNKVSRENRQIQVMSDIDLPYATFGRYSADLCLFLLAARHGQLSHAARLAGLSQPRMSQRIRFLEDSLGKQLFVRERRGITLTQAGQELLDAISTPLSGAVEAFSRYQQKPARGGVIILCDIAFASFRLLPVFSSLCNRFGELSISLLTVQQPRHKNLPEADLIIRMEDEHEPAENELCLFRESVSVLCSPGYKQAHPDMSTPNDLVDKTLVELTADGTPAWFTWATWLRAHGVDRKLSTDHLTFNSYDHVIQSTIAGLGVCLGWRGLVDNLVADGALLQAVPDQLASNRGYFLKIAPGCVNRDTRQVFDWLAAHLRPQPAEASEKT